MAFPEMELSRLAVLPARPPTPPKESTGLPSSQDSDPIQAPQKDSHPGLHTPTESPASAHPTSKSSERRSKRVGFRLGSSKLNNASSSSPDGSSSVKSNPSSKEMKPAKSILKPTRKPEISMSLDDGQTRDFPRMLEDFCQQLAGSDMSSRLDAYITLNNNLKTYKNGPEQRALVEKMPLLTSFVERELQDADATSNARGTQLATEVVKLVSTLLWSPTMADELPESFQLFILNKAINVAGSDKASKALVSQFLHLLAIQRFRPKILTNDKINRLLSFLKHIEERVKGKQIIAHRLDIYKRLIGQTPSLMSIRFRDWYEHIFHALMSTTKEIRARALSLGFEAGQTFGASEQVTKAVSSLFSHMMETNGVEQRYGDLFAARLGEWLNSKEEARHVPQVWSCILMFLRHQPRPLERWSFILTWLQLMKKCFNSTDNETRLQANRAWIRLIFAIDPCLTTGDSMVALLREPIRSQLDRARGTDKDTARMKASVLAVYSTLLYYTMRPGAAHDTLDRYWKACVAPFFSTPLERVTTLETPTAADLLCSLLGDRLAKPWTPKRALEALPIKPEDVHRLDSKWIRQRVGWIAPLVEAVLLDEAWWKTNSDQPPSMRVWKCFMGALADAGRKEIKVSAEAKVAVAELVGVLERFLTASGSPLRYERFTRLIDVACTSLGPLPFTEPKLIGSEKGHYQVSDAPSNHSRKLPSSGTPTTIILLSHLVLNATNNEETGFEDAASKLFDIALRSATSRRTRHSVLRDTYLKAARNEKDLQSNTAKFMLWRIAMKFIISNVHTKSDEALVDSSRRAIYDYHDATKMFEYGLDLAQEAQMVWNLIEEAITSQLSEGNGQAAACAQTIEPLAKFFSDRTEKCLDQGIIRAATKFLERVHWPTQRAGTDGLHRKIPGLTSPNKTSSPDTCGNLYRMVEGLVSSIYGQEDLITHATYADLLSSVLTLVSRIPTATVASTLHRLQPTLAYLTRDHEGRIKVDTRESTDLFKQVVGVWDGVLQKVQELLKFDASNFGLLKDLMLCGLGSRHRAIANLTIQTWNGTFGLQDSLSYPQELSQTLMFLSRTVDIRMPGVENMQEMKTLPLSIEYLDTPVNLDEFSDKSDCNDAYSKNGWSHEATGREPLSDLNQNEQSVSTPVKQRTSNKAQMTPRLRHDNSQIEFAEITSSPPNLETIESQLLTERQREVRDRQQAAAAAMFPDLRSSPRAKSIERKHELPRLKLRPEQDLEHSDIDDSHSPTLPSPGGTPYLGSSPTPSQRRQSSRDRHSAAPEAHAAAPAKQSDNKEIRSEDQSSDPSSGNSTFGQTYGEELLALYEQPLGDESLDIVDIVMPSDFSAEVGQSSADEPVEPMLLVTAGDDTHYDHNYAADESTSLAPETKAPEKETITREAWDVPQDPASESTEQAVETESSQVEAQILSDMIEATPRVITSQVEAEVDSQMDSQKHSQKDSRESQTRSSKRKRSKGHSDSRSHKRHRGRPKKHQEQTSEATLADDDMEDCIVVAVSKCVKSSDLSSSRAPATSGGDNVSSSAAETGKPEKSKKRKHVQEVSVDEQGETPETPLAKKSKVARESELLTETNTQTSTECVQPETVETVIEEHEEATPATEVAATQTTPSRNRLRAITGEDFLARIRELVADAKQVVLRGHGDDIMAGLMDLGKEIMTAKRRD